jgi:glycosyltransferase involved in cell wall biosynthesis
MKIGITTFGADGGKSGISRYLINLLKEFSRLESEFEFELLVYEDEVEIFLNNIENIYPLTFSKRIASPALNIAWHQLSLGKICKERGYDLLFLPAGNRRLPLILPCPSVGTVHDLSSLHVKGKYNKIRQFYLFKILPLLVRKLTKVLTVSDSSKKDILNFIGVPEEKILVTLLAADGGQYYPRNRDTSLAELKNRYPLRDPFILYTSRIEHPGKNHVRLIEAFNSLKSKEGIPHQLVFAGSDWSRAEIVHQAAQNSASADDIVFTGFVSEADLPIFYTAADLFLFPSLYEGFGLPILEAMLSEIPIACSNLSSLPEVAGDGALLFNPHNVESIAEAISLILSDRKIRQTLIQKGRDRSRQFSWEKTDMQTLTAFRDVLNEKTPPPKQTT